MTNPFRIQEIKSVTRDAVFTLFERNKNLITYIDDRLRSIMK